MRKKTILQIHYHARKLRGLYRQFFKKNQPWGIRKEHLLTYPEDSLGLTIGQFLQKHRIDLVPQFENHDAAHVLTGIGILFKEEIALKCYMLGNGRHNMFHLASTLGGVLAFPEQYAYFKRHYQQGKKAHPFHHIDFLALLNEPLEGVRKNYLIISIIE